MELVIAVFAGYLIGSIPTAGWLGRLKHIDLRAQGSGNPGAANALSTGGPALAAVVLLVEMAKGAGAALIGEGLGGDGAVLAAGLAAVVGNLYNVWYRFRGGKGLGIAAGVLLVAWPLIVGPAILVIAVSAWATRSPGAATIVVVAGLVVASLLWEALELPDGWGIPASMLPVLAVGLALAILPKHVKGARFRRIPAV